MIIVLISSFLTGRKASSETAPAPPSEAPAVSASDGDKVLPHTAPYTDREAREIYRACVNLAATMEKARELEPAPDIVWLVEALNGTALRHGRKDNVPHARLMQAIDLVDETCEKTYLGPKSVKQRDNWKLADAEGFNRLLPMILGVLADDDAEVDKDPASEFWEEYQVRAGLKEPSAEHPLLVSTTETCVRLHHDGVGEFYEIELARIPDHGALVKWIEHIGAKTWVTAKTIRLFVGAVCSAKGWKLHETSSL